MNSNETRTVLIFLNREWTLINTNVSAVCCVLVLTRQDRFLLDDAEARNAQYIGADRNCPGELLLGPDEGWRSVYPADE